jgi:hypothetical protein
MLGRKRLNIAQYKEEESMNTRKFFIVVLLLTMASLSWGIDLGLCDTTRNGKSVALKKKVELKKKTPSQVRKALPPQVGEVPPPPGTYLSPRNQRMLEMAESAKIRRANFE